MVDPRLTFILIEFIEGALEVIQVSNLYCYPHDRWMFGSPLQHSSLKNKDKKRKSFPLSSHGHS